MFKDLWMKPKNNNIIEIITVQVKQETPDAIITEKGNTYKKSDIERAKECRPSIVKFIQEGRWPVF